MMIAMAVNGLQLFVLGLLFLLSPCSSHAAAFATSSTGSGSGGGGAFALWETFVNGISTLNKPSSTAPSPDDLKRNQLKQQLLEECRASNSQQNREGIEAIMAELAPLSPVKDTASSPLLQRKWLLEWTTEKEINFFNDWGISNGKIAQTIDGAVLENLIEFQRGGSLGVKGALSIGGEVRTNFEFTTATLDLGSWGTYSLPPVGKGWFDTIYLDDELRVDTNSRNDILICTPDAQL